MTINAMQLPVINTQVQNDETSLPASKKPSNDPKKTSDGLKVLIATTIGVAFTFFAYVVSKAIFYKPTDGRFDPYSVLYGCYEIASMLDPNANKWDRIILRDAVRQSYFDHQLSRNLQLLNSYKHPLNVAHRLLEKDMQVLTNLNTGYVSTLSVQEREKFQSSVALAIGRREQQDGSSSATELHRMCYKSVFGEDIKQ